jgi:hypothetical protein
MRPSSFRLPLAAFALVWAFAAQAGTSPAFTVPFQDNDYAAALKQAQAKGLPVFVESWAPW